MWVIWRVLPPGAPHRIVGLIPSRRRHRELAAANAALAMRA